MTAVTYPVTTRHEWLRLPRTAVCPVCGGTRYTTIEVREHATVWDPEYTVTIPVTCYRTRRCWRCHGTGEVTE
jgi:hypothetical protein